MKKYTLISALCGTVFCVLVLAATAIAQPGSGGPVPDPSPNPPTTTPIDGGVTLLLAAGGAYGLKRLRNRRNKA